MAATTYENLALQWRPESKSDQAFLVTMIIIMLVFGGLGFIITTTKLTPQRVSRALIAERVATYVTKPPQPKIEEKAPPPIPLPPPKPEHKDKPLTKEEKKAREDAFKKSGLQNLQKQLSELMDTSSVDAVVKQQISKNASSASAATVNTNILTANAGTGSGGVNDNRYVASVGQTKLDQGGQGVATTLQNTAVANKPKPSASGSKAGSGGYSRTEEDIANVIDQHKGVLQSLFRRASRNKPGLKGKLVLEVTVLPSGKVAKIVVKSSELHDAGLEESIIARIKLFDFGVRKGDPLTVTVPVEFLPS